jgi:hypothetical protein
MSTPKTSSTLSISDIRHLFATSADANVVRDCVRAIGAGVGGVFDHGFEHFEHFQQEKAVDRLVLVYNSGTKSQVVVEYRDFSIKSVEFRQPYHIYGMLSHYGYNVCSKDGWINVMPGAVWFMTVAEAMRGVDFLIEAGGSPRPPYQSDDGVGQRFWKLMELFRTSSTRD